MKKLMLLLLMGLVTAGLVTAAAPAHPPGTPAVELTAWIVPAVLPGYAADCHAVTPGTVPALFEQAGCFAVLDNNCFTEPPQRDIPIKLIDRCGEFRRRPDYRIRE